jgi:hypothetical protein
MLTNGPSIQPQQHEMQLEKIHTSGAEEWYCPQCGRRFLLSWPPAYERVILEPGDEYATHIGGKGGLRIGSSEVSDIEEPVFSDELRAALEEALADIDFDNW